jgi:hypothetical protein
MAGQVTPTCQNEKEEARLKSLPVLAIVIVQTFLCLAHWFLYCTWIDFWWPLSGQATDALRVAFLLLSFLFLVATVLSFRVANRFVTLLYRAACLWLGLLNFLFWAAWIAWIIDLALRVAVPDSVRLQIRPWLAGGLLLAAIALTLYGLVNARTVRLRRISIKLANLPAAWVGRTALVVSDIHLGNINGERFARRIAGMARQLNPDIIFIPGDLFDGAKVNCSTDLQTGSAAGGLLRHRQSRGVRRRRAILRCAAARRHPRNRRPAHRDRWPCDCRRGLPHFDPPDPASPCAHEP